MKAYKQIICMVMIIESVSSFQVMAADIAIYGVIIDLEAHFHFMNQHIRFEDDPWLITDN